MPGPDDYSLSNPMLQMGNDDHPFIMPDGDSAKFSGRPSLEGSGPQMGKASGIGGTVVGAEGGMGRPHPSATGQHTPDLSPEQMMAMANEMEQNQLEDAVRQKASAQMGQSSVQGSLDHTGAQTAGQTPSWLNDYMQHQPFTDPYHQVPMSGLDAIKANKYLTERERLKYTKSLRK